MLSHLTLESLMKAWCVKFRISTAIDEGRSLPRTLREQIVRDPGLSEFAKDAEALDELLARGPRRASLPEGLHESIVRAVVEGTREPRPGSSSSLWRWLALPAAAAVMLLVSLVGNAPVEPRPSLAPAARALEVSQEIVQTVPVAVLGPLTEEWRRLERDLDNTANFLLASLP